MDQSQVVNVAVVLRFVHYFRRFRINDHSKFFLLGDNMLLLYDYTDLHLKH